jgi:hypothetical protein
MKYLLGIAILLASVVSVSQDFNSRAPKIPLDLDSAQYEALLSQSNTRFGRQDQSIETILRIGKRNLDWLKKINSNRETKLSFTGPHTRKGYPIHEPKKYNKQTIVAEFDQKLKSLPSNMKNILLGRGDLPEQPPMDEATYLKLGREIDTSYQNASRWKLLVPYLPGLEEIRFEDIRGWYFLSRDPQLVTKLNQFQRQPADVQNYLKKLLVGVCYNTLRSFSQCQSQLDREISANNVLDFYNRYKSRSVQIWNGFFMIEPGSLLASARRTPGGLRVPFEPVDREDLRSFLKNNLEQEWQWKDFKVSIDFVRDVGAIEVIWKPGVTPHVPSLGAHQIIMDANTSLNEWEVQWTIKHEFGHNLGFPDCYIEFYEKETGMIVAYQMDISDIMCSRKGDIKKRHIDELARVYGGRL